jgi:hypothetical protein
VIYKCKSDIIQTAGYAGILRMKKQQKDAELSDLVSLYLSKNNHLSLRHLLENCIAEWKEDPSFKE